MDQDKKMSVDDLLARVKAIPDEVIERNFKKRVEEGTPNNNGSCKKEGCSGRVVKRVTGLSSSGYHYSMPECNVCGRQYIFTGYMHIPVVGMKEFEEMMNKPFII